MLQKVENLDNWPAFCLKDTYIERRPPLTEPRNWTTVLIIIVLSKVGHIFQKCHLIFILQVAGAKSNGNNKSSLRKELTFNADDRKICLSTSILILHDSIILI